MLPGLLLALLLATASTGVAGHGLGESYATLTVAEDGAVRVVYRLRLDALARLGDPTFAQTLPLQEAFAMEVLSGYRVTTPEGRCTPGPASTRQDPLFLTLSVRFACAGPGPHELRDDAFFGVLPDHLHFARTQGPEGGFLGERVLDRDGRTWALPAVPPRAPLDVLLRYGRTGVEHILSGWDHLAFLGALLLLVADRRGVLLAITGFTVGHSITLVLTVLGRVRPEGPLVEALIGLTIALVAGEAAMARHGRLRAWALTVLVGCAGAATAALVGGGPSPAAVFGTGLFFACHLLLLRRLPHAAGPLTALVTALFGMVHGFGFAGSLLELGLPPDRLALALLAFNVGIEVAQLGIVLVLALALRDLGRVARDRLGNRNLWTGPAAAALCAVGLFWFVERGWA